jgi:type II secretory pathway pseudopilin PulG
MLKINQKQTHHESGFTLLEVLFTMGMLGVTAYISTQNTLFIQKTTESIRIGEEMSRVREYIRNATDCGQTLRTFTDPLTRAISCAGTIELRNFQNNPILSEVLGWSIRSRCDSATGLTVDIQKVVNGAVVEHPTTGQPLSFVNPAINPVFGRLSQHGLCQSSFERAPKALIVIAAMSNVSGASITACNQIKATPPISEADNRARFAAHSTIKDGCHQFCQANPQSYASGYFLDCNAGTSEVQCVCIR